MLKKIIYFFAIIGFTFAAVQCHGQSSSSPSASESEDVIDDNDEYIRENPVMMPAQEDETGGLEINYSKYPFLNLNSNKIALNGDNWSSLKNLFKNSGDTVISIVHIGDSHLQSEGASQRTRALLQKRYGSAGRGLITPLKLASTNQPSDYHISSNSSFLVSKLMKKPWSIPMGFTGVALQPKSTEFDFSISVKRSEGSEPDFDIIKMFCNGRLPKLISVKGDDLQVSFTQQPKGDTLEIFLHEPAETVNLDFVVDGKCEIYGFQLENQMAGVEYSVIGNNGATFQSYLAYGKMGESLKTLLPNLIILSLGNNEAFSNITESEFYSQIDSTIKDLKKNVPYAKILLTTPAECQRSSVVRGRKGRASRSYKPNAKCELLRNVVLKYGKEKGIPTWDWFNVSGGTGASEKWASHGLVQDDHIHNTWDGYHLQGNLLYEALVNAVEK